jgi:hypothetical protein
MRNILDKLCRENQHTHFMFTFVFENRAVYEIMSKNVVEPDRPQMTSKYGAICWISKATCTRTRAHMHKYIILIAFQQQQRFARAPHSYIIQSNL